MVASIRDAEKTCMVWIHKVMAATYLENPD